MRHPDRQQCCRHRVAQARRQQVELQFIKSCHVVDKVHWLQHVGVELFHNGVSALKLALFVIPMAIHGAMCVCCLLGDEERRAFTDTHTHARTYGEGQTEKDQDRMTETERQRQRQRLNAKRPACQSNKLTDATQNSLTVAEHHRARWAHVNLLRSIIHALIDKCAIKNFISAFVLCCVCVQVFFAGPAHFA